MGTVRWQVSDEDGERIVKEIHKVVVHTINMGDVEDPDLMVAAPIYEWQQSDAGKFAMANAIPESPEWRRELSHYHMGWRYAIIVEMEKKKLSEFYLRFGKPDIK